MKISHLFAALALGTASLAASAADLPGKLADGALVAANGMTLYTFDKDVAGSSKSVCNGPCAGIWPPLAAKATDTASGPWGFVTRDDGARQWSYKGQPVYFYQPDQKAGERKGDKVQNVWHIIKE